MKSGRRNSITDIEGILVGNQIDTDIRSGVTAIVCERPTIASVHVMGGAPGTRETELLSPENTVDTVNGIVLSGGSAYGLDAAAGAMAAFRSLESGFQLNKHAVPIVPAAILFDLANGGSKDWGEYPPYRELGKKAVESAGQTFELGSNGAGYGALVSGLKGGLGTASQRLDSGVTIGAIVAVNALGQATIGSTGHFWAAPFEIGDEFGGLSLPTPMPGDAHEVRLKFREHLRPGTNTTIGAIATDALLSKSQSLRLAIAAHDGLARALWPSHTPFDGDLVFSLATGTSRITPETAQWINLCAAAAATMTRAIARAIFHAATVAGDILPSWSARFGR